MAVENVLHSNTLKWRFPRGTAIVLTFVRIDIKKYWIKTAAASDEQAM